MKYLYIKILNYLKLLKNIELLYIKLKYFLYNQNYSLFIRQKFLNKHADFKTPQEVSKYFDSPCIMVGIKGQTKEMIDYDISMLKEHFESGTINVYTNNTTDIKRDDELVKWFMEKYSYLEDDNSVEVLYVNTDFGVGD